MLPELLGLDRAPVSLTTVLAEAPAWTRIDRKYVVPVASARAFLAALSADWQALEFAGRRSTHYRSTYFDTPDWRAAREHVQRRRHRWKVRRRTYVEDHLCRLEVKTKDGRGHTVKTVVDTGPDEGQALTAEERRFVASVLDSTNPSGLDGLAPSMEVEYERLTLARVGDRPGRVTIDWRVGCSVPGAAVRMDEQHVLVESKGTHLAADADRLLLSLGHRPRWFSKYTAAACLLAPDLPDNDVRALRGRLLHVTDPGVGAARAKDGAA